MRRSVDVETSNHEEMIDITATVAGWTPTTLAIEGDNTEYRRERSSP